MKVNLTTEGPQLSRIIAGVMNWGVWGAQLSEQDMSKLIVDCCAMGVTTFDHADIYGMYTTEGEFGKAFQMTGLNREDVQYITKCGICLPSDTFPSFNIKSYNTTKEHIIQSVERSLSELKTDYIDVLLIHRPSPLLDPKIVADAIHQLKSEGKILHFGVSNFTPMQLDMLASYCPIVTNQVEASVMATDVFLDGTLDHALQHRYLPMAWSPLGGGSLFSSTSEYDLVSKRGRLLTVCDKLGLELDDLCYAFLLHHPSRILPITGSSKIDRIKKAVSGMEIELSNQDWFMIWEACLGNEVP